MGSRAQPHDGEGASRQCSEAEPRGFTCKEFDEYKYTYGGIDREGRRFHFEWHFANDFAFLTWQEEEAGH